MNLLESLTKDEFVDNISCISTTSALCSALDKSDELKALRNAYEAETLTEENIAEFVSFLMKDFEKGKFFKHNIALAALAVFLVKHSSSFANKFLDTLSSLRAAEMSMSSNVARACLGGGK